MKYMSAKKKFYCKLPMNLQFFAESGEDSGGTSGSASSESSGSIDSSKPSAATLSFDDFLKGEGNQAEFDRRVSAAIESAVSTAQQKWQLMTDDKVSEAEKLAKMTAAEKATYQQQKYEKELAAREANIIKRELMAEAKVTLADKGIPVELADILDYKDKKSHEASIKKVEAAFQSAVKKAVDEKLKGSEPLKKKGSDKEQTLEQQILTAMSGY